MAEESHENSLQEQLDALKKENKRLREQYSEEKKGIQVDEVLEWIKGQSKEKMEPRIKDYPLTSVLIAFGAGYIISSILNRR